MNLNDVFNLPEKQWTPKGMEVTATVKTIAPAQENGQYGWKQKVMLVDATGAAVIMTVQSKFEDGLIRHDEIGKTMQWMAKWYAGRESKVLCGYTTSPRDTSKPDVAPPPPDNRTKLDNTPDWDSIAEGKVRHGLVCAYIQSGSEPDIDRVKYWVAYIMTGTAPLVQDDDSRQFIPDDEIPF